MILLSAVSHICLESREPAEEELVNLITWTFSRNASVDHKPSQCFDLHATGSQPFWLFPVFPICWHSDFCQRINLIHLTCNRLQLNVKLA